MSPSERVNGWVWRLPEVREVVGGGVIGVVPECPHCDTSIKPQPTDRRGVYYCEVCGREFRAHDT